MNVKRWIMPMMIGISSVLVLLGLLQAPLPPTQAAAPASWPAAAPSAAGLSVLVPAGAIQVDDVFSVTVRAANVLTPLSAFQFDLAYDPAVLSFLYAVPGPFLGASGRQVICPPPAAPTAGVTRLACASAGAARGATGAGDLLILTFRAMAQGQSSLSLRNVQLADAGRPPALISAAVQDNVVTVGESCIALSEVGVTGPPTGTTGVGYTFSATANPLTGTASLPITYTWQTDERPVIIHANGGLTDTAVFTWTDAGPKTITVTAVNACGSDVATHTIAITAPEEPGYKIYLPAIFIGLTQLT